MYELANAYYLGEGVAENPSLAVRYFRRAANLGHAGSAYMLGQCLLDGVGVPHRDRATALEWIITAAELGHQLARKRVAIILNEEYKNILSKSNNQVQTHVELVIKQLNEPTKDFLNKINR